MRDGNDPLKRGLGRQAASFELLLVLGTVTVVAALGRPQTVGESDWVAFAVLLSLVAVTSLLGADRTRHQGSQLALAPIFTAVLILPPSLTTLLVGVAVLPGWLRKRDDVRLLVFNLCNLVAPALLARAVFDAAGESASAGWTLGAALAILTFLVLHYSLLASVLHLARGVRPAETIRLDYVLVDAGLLSLGAIAAALWDSYPGLVPLTFVPLVLAYRSLAVPTLLEATRIELKTGLYNLGHFQATVDQEVGRAGRFDRTTSLLLVDVDGLRQVNAVHGRPAGDRVLQRVARALENATRDYDVCARVGGDEFCVLLPETDLDAALLVAERIRTVVEESTPAGEVPVTASIGVVSSSGDAVAGERLLALADQAAFEAKVTGRNAIVAAPPIDPVAQAEGILSDSAG